MSIKTEHLWAITKAAYQVGRIDLAEPAIRELVAREADLILSEKRVVDWGEVGSALSGYLILLVILFYLVIYRPIERIIEFWRVRP